MVGCTTWRRGAGLDLGSVFAYGLAAIDPMDRWWWIGEFYDEGQLSTKQRGDTLQNRRLYWDGLLVIADPAQKQERQDLLIEANVVTVLAITDVMLGITQVKQTLELGPDGLPMMVMISDERAHMVEPFKDDPHARPDGARPDRVHGPHLPLCFQQGWPCTIHTSRGGAPSHAVPRETFRANPRVNELGAEARA
jgi:hypothetical protein